MWWLRRHTEWGQEPDGKFLWCRVTAVKGKRKHRRLSVSRMSEGAENRSKFVVTGERSSQGDRTEEVLRKNNGRADAPRTCCEPARASVLL